MKTYVITGATGNTGKHIAMGLLEKGQKVRIISRNAEKAKELTDQGAELFLGDTTNKELLLKAFKGADAVYAMIPFDMNAIDYTEMQLSHGRTIAEAIKEAGVKYVVFLSSVGAHLIEGAGVVQGLERTERLLNSITGLNTMHLRAAYFMENTMAQIGAIKYMGMMASPVPGDLEVPMVATKDIAQVALNHLLNLDFKGTNHKYVLGQRDVSYDEVARLFGNAIGMPDLKYNAVSIAEGKAAMMQMGMGESATDSLLEFVSALNDGRVLEDARRDEHNTTPTSIEDFAHTFAYVYNMKQE
ncbi:MAG: NmrA family NAD(P)-binding protein [Bacteroidales bacterium]|nr:NmrA family NAD(P)-binding protein [Bacteroidales bacterium]